MEKVKKFNLGVLVVAVLLVGGLLSPSLTTAQEAPNQILLSWEADTFVPAQYLGKALPSTGSTVTVYAQLLVDGRFVSPNNYDIRWFLNKRLFKEGRGLSHIGFEVAPRESQYEVAVLFSGSGNRSFEEEVVIPVAEPLVVIDSPHFENRVSPENIWLRAWPYFFAVDGWRGLSLSWIVNNNLVAIRARELLFDVDAPLGSSKVFPVVARARVLSTLEEVESDRLILGLKSK